ncbi:leucyl aminopeptidase [Marinicella sp. S1101]|uniref:leucyl aminopeptidase n=1 Tax=Marinicella marina TaxID=2996016 RepID=UPI002260D0CB|nr:leucyl aminopeptidase [Marinicella marina]MCX7554027.1 leucyl aminopeptidase [Marinicella marina]MDJ1140519.1 leucyl aminopeptidase [Marinicella marina]
MKIWSLIVLTSLSLNLAQAHNHKDSLPTAVEFSESLPVSGNLLLGVYADGSLGQYGSTLDKSTNGGINHAIKATEFEAKKDSTQLITAPKGSGLAQILLVGLGDKADKLTHLDWQNLGGNAVQTAVTTFKTAPAMAFDVNDSEITANLAFGAKLGAYYFDKYYTDEERHKQQTKLTLITQQAAAAEHFYKTELSSVANAIWHARNVANEPANVIFPQSFVERWESHFDGMKNIKIKVLDEKDMIKQNMGAIYGVGRGSKRPPRMMVVEFMNGNSDEAPILLVGKGITFDTGGISLKNPTNMWNMKFDMSGAASVMGTLYALAGRDAKVNVVAVAALAENMPGGNAQRPGDVVTSMSGKTISIRSTDAEGRLVLADGNYYADVTYDPKLLINLATLTGSASRATGKDYAAMFTRHDELVSDFITAGKASGDQVWQLPLNDNHFKAIEHTVADVMNSGPDAPGASAGAAFLGTFVRETTPWVHFDIAGVAYRDDATPSKASPGSTSFGIRLLNNYIKANFE